MTSSPRRALVAGHGDFAAGVVSAVAQISGRGDAFATMSNRGMGAEEIEREMRERVASFAPQVIFTDLQAGSCTIAARRVLRDVPDVVLVTGANVATLLAFVFDDAPPSESAEQAVEKGRISLAVAGAPRGA
jgi:PTS system N-acetylgalactosamine-specific IIA component